MKPSFTALIFARAARGLYLCLLIAAVLTLCAGCSEVRFVDKKDFARVNDPREDIRLINVSADLTTAGVVQQRVLGDEAVYSQSRNLLFIKEIVVNTFGQDGTTQGITVANTGAIYLADSAESGRKRNDMHFAGGVNYRSPSKDRKDTDTLQLTTDELIYVSAAQEFQGVSTHSVVMLPPGKRPLYLTGSKLRVPRELNRFSMAKGSLGPDPAQDHASSYTQLRKELEVAAGAATKSASKPLEAPAPIELPKLEPAPQKPVLPDVPAIEAAPQRPQLPDVPAIEPAPTRTPRPGVLR